MRNLPAALFATLGWLLFSANALAWDSATHRMIARLAIAALPASPLMQALAMNEKLVEQHAVEPDSVLKERYGRREDIRHYIDLEVLNPDAQDALAELNPNIETMRRRFGRRKLHKAGTLPWTIEDKAQLFSDAWRKRDCSAMILQAGYLAHYVGDASQPLHSTVHYDGYRRDRGVHARVEKAADDMVATIEPAAAKEVRLENISAVWPAEIDELREANSLIGKLLAADRKARAAADNRSQYDAELFSDAGALVTRQIADAASVLASIWLFEWKAAGSPNACQSRVSDTRESF